MRFDIRSATVLLALFCASLVLAHRAVPPLRLAPGPAAPTIASAPPPPAVQPTAAAPEADSWPVYLVVAGVAHATDGTALALPGGSRFQLRATPDRDGEIVIRAGHEGVIDPTPLWRGNVSAGQPFTSPVFRLQGRKGREALELTLQPHDAGASTARRIELQHL